MPHMCSKAHLLASFLARRRRMSELTQLLAWFPLVLFTFLPMRGTAQQAAFDLNGKAFNPFRDQAGKVVVLVFLRRDCPVSGRYAPVIQEMAARHNADARFYLVFPDKSESAPAMRQYLREFHYSIAALRDPSHALVRLAQAQITPEAAVFDAKGTRVYHGRIDNLYEAFGRSRPAPTTHELESAIQDAVAGRQPPNQGVEAVGCYIADLE
jgi:hypothetical protein